MQPFAARDGYQLLQFGLEQIDLVGVGADVGDDGELDHGVASLRLMSMSEV